MLETGGACFRYGFLVLFFNLTVSYLIIYIYYIYILCTFFGQAQVQCSDALKNAPFALLVPNSTTSNSNQFASKPTNFHIRPNDTYATTSRFGAGVNQNAPLLVTIPKQDQLPVPIATYSLQQEVRFMPVVRHNICVYPMCLLLCGKRFCWSSVCWNVSRLNVEAWFLLILIFSLEPFGQSNEIKCNRSMDYLTTQT